jgi:putative transposase
MKKSRFTETQIISILKEADAGVKVKDICRRHGISDATYYNWKSKYGGMSASDLKRMKEMERELSQYKRMYAELAHENFALKDLIEKKL